MKKNNLITEIKYISLWHFKFPKKEKKKCYGQVVRKLNKINKAVKRLIQVVEEFNFGLFCFVCLFNSGFADILWRETSDKVVTSIIVSNQIQCHVIFDVIINLKDL